MVVGCEVMVLIFLYWGLYGWVLYVLVGVVLGYFVYCWDLLLVLCLVLYLIFGECIYGCIGDMVDGFGILVMLILMVINFGIGVLVV